MHRLLAVILLVASVSSTTFDTCALGPAPLAVRVIGCDAQPCKFVRGENIVAEIDVAVDHEVNKITPGVKATVSGFTVNYPLPQPDGCKSLTNSKCPLDAGKEFTYRLEMPIYRIYPLVKVDIELTLLDQNQIPVECFRLSGQVVN